MRRIIGPEVRLWNLNPGLTCIAPDFWLETMISVRLGTRWPDVMFGTAEETKSVLKSQGRNSR
jgi:hypothetical protein